MSRRERTETIVECDACNRTMREQDRGAIATPNVDLCEFCVTALLKLEKKLADAVLTPPVRLAIDAKREKARAV